MLNGLDEFFATRQAALGLRAQRSETLASNIANADTPGYKARDFDFPTALKAALGGSGGPQAPRAALTQTSARHLPGGNHPHGLVNMQYRIPAQASIDGNTVELDAELGQFSDNSIRYQADLTFLSNQIRSMQQAISNNNS